MNKNDLIGAVAEAAGLTKSDAASAVEGVFDAITSSLKKGDEVQTIGGEFGRVVDTKDDRVLIKVDETSNTKIWYSKNSIHKVVTEEKAEAK